MSFWIFEKITKRIQDDMSAAIENYHSSSLSREAWDNTHRYVRLVSYTYLKMSLKDFNWTFLF